LEERIQKLISACGLASRRAAEEWIAAGRVTVNGEKARLGDRADLDRDTVLVDGKPLAPGGGRTYLMLNKPRGYVTTLSDEKGRKTVIDLVAGCGTRVWPVGRLDMDSEGLLILTDDGALTHQLLHPSHEVDKEYLVWVTGNVNKALPILSAPMTLDGERLAPAQVPILSAPMTLDGERLAPAQVRRGRDSGGVHQLSVTVHQGKNRQVRRMCAQAGLKVLRLKRVREGPLSLDRSLKAGQWRTLTDRELLELTGPLSDR